MHTAIWLIGAYLAGSIPASFLIAKLAKGIDIRQHGSGNPGATNVFRVAGPVPGIFAFIADFLKGFLPVYFAWNAFGHGRLGIVLLIGLCAILGHMYTIFLNFKGGKGVATGAGVFAALVPIPTVCAFAVFGAVFALTRYVSLGSIIAAAAFAAFTWVLREPVILSIFSTVIAAAIIYKHRTNIQSLIAGTERKTGAPSGSHHTELKKEGVPNE
jgi:glycerol-3-phosphate acyltransferase PlsY